VTAGTFLSCRAHRDQHENGVGLGGIYLEFSRFLRVVKGAEQNGTGAGSERAQEAGEGGTVEGDEKQQRDGEGGKIGI
jgi:hypothetical protein